MPCRLHWKLYGAVACEPLRDLALHFALQTDEAGQHECSISTDALGDELTDQLALHKYDLEDLSRYRPGCFGKVAGAGKPAGESSVLKACLGQGRRDLVPQSSSATGAATTASTISDAWQFLFASNGGAPVVDLLPENWITERQAFLLRCPWLGRSGSP